MDKEERIIEEQMALEEAKPTAQATDLISMAQITVTQLPIIEERLRDVKAAVEATVADAKSMVATPDTIQAVKARRAELNKQFDTLDAQRKAVKEQITAPYNRFDAVFKECIAVPFKEADQALKATVDGFEGELKAKAMKKLEDYYYELCALDQIDFLTFEQAIARGKIKIELADCRKKKPTKAMDALANFMGSIAIGRDAISKMEDSAEIMVEFEKCLDAGQAAGIVAERKRKVREAAEAEERRNGEETARQREMQARVEAAAPIPAPPPITPPAPVATPPQAAEQPMCWKKMSFTIYFRNQEEYQKALPELKALKEKLVQEGIQYGK